MIKVLFAVGIAASLGLATLPIEVSAKGLVSHASHIVGPTFFTKSSVRHHRGAFGYGPYGGLVVADQAISGEFVGDMSRSQALGPVISTSIVLQCHHSVETVTVPSEDRGVAEHC
jgi:hypothetical protein